MNAPFAPRAADQIASWAETHHTSIESARRRFVQAIAIYAIASEPGLRSTLRLYGSGALALLHGLRRTPGDIDFFCRHQQAQHVPFRQLLQQHMQRALNGALERFTGFDPTLRAVAAKEIKIQVADADKLRGDDFWHTLHFDPPASICGAIAEEAVALKLRTLYSSFRSHKPRDQDVYDVADASRRLRLDESQLLLHYRSFASRDALDPANFAVRREATERVYREKLAAGEYDIPWEPAWECYWSMRTRMEAARTS